MRLGGLRCRGTLHGLLGRGRGGLRCGGDRGGAAAAGAAAAGAACDGLKVIIDGAGAAAARVIGTLCAGTPAWCAADEPAMGTVDVPPPGVEGWSAAGAESRPSVVGGGAVASP